MTQTQLPHLEIKRVYPPEPKFAIGQTVTFTSNDCTASGSIIGIQYYGGAIFYSIQGLEAVGDNPASGLEWLKNNESGVAAILEEYIHSDSLPSCEFDPN